MLTSPRQWIWWPDKGRPNAYELLSDCRRFHCLEVIVTEPGIEALTVSILPGRAWFDVSRLGADRFGPSPHGLRHELGPLSKRMNAGGPRRMNVIRQHVDDIDRVLLLLYPDHQALSRVLIDHVQGPERPPVMSSFMDEVVRPYVIWMLWPQTDARSIVAARFIYDGRQDPDDRCKQEPDRRDP